MLSTADPPQASPVRDLPPPPPAPPPSATPGLWRRLPWPRLALAAAVLAVGAWAWGQYALSREAFRAMDAELEKMERRLAALPPLSEAEITLLRRTTNPRHLAAAESLGIPPVTRRGSLERTAREAGLVRIEPTPRYRLLDATHSIYAGTHGVRRTLDSISVRFWDRLTARDLPGFRYTVSSMLRSTEDQAALRGVNVNAAGGTSSHEHGTTYDITYRRFGYASGAPEPDFGRLPRDLAPVLRSQVRQRLRVRRAAAYRAMAREHAEPLAAELGRALIELEDEGVLLALRERRQPVYHITALLADGPVTPTAR